ncbi:MAG: hypothetical protein CFH39_00886, partial [Alphaproteobacteria bacterium MarineAlpha10_Bin2]
GPISVVDASTLDTSTRTRGMSAVRSSASRIGAAFNHLLWGEQTR